MQDRPKKRKQALGRGLDALIPGAVSVPQAEPAAEPDSPTDYFPCPLDQIRANPYQPRRVFAQEELEELSQSIRSQGIIQPLVVRKNGSDYELVAGERRLRAAKLAGLTEVPVVVRQIGETALLIFSLVENIQRQNLNPMEEARAYDRLINEFELTQEDLAERVGKSRSAVSNYLRLLQLPQDIQTALSEGRLSMGHAKVLLGADSIAQQKALFQKITDKGLSVRQSEQLLKQIKEAGKNGDAGAQPAEPDSETIYFNSLCEDLSRHFGTKVDIRRKGQRGKVEIEFYSDEDLDRLLGLLNPQ